MAERDNTSGRTIIGIILILIGSLLFLQNIRLEFWNINIFSWPIILLIIGTVILVNDKRSSGAWILILIGIIGLISKYSGYSLRYLVVEYWPFLLIAFGIHLIFKRTLPQEKNKNELIEVEEYLLDKFSFFNDSTLKIITNNFVGGKVTSILSDYMIDLRESEIKGQQEIDSVSIFGGTTFYLKENQQVSFKATTIIGAYEDKRAQSDIVESENVLIIKGIVLFGGIEIK